MTSPLTCQQVVCRLTDLEDGAVPLAEGIRLRLHLLRCPQCHQLNAEVRRLPAIVEIGLRLETQELLPLAQGALRAAQSRIKGFRPRRRPQPSPIPSELQRLLQSGGDLSLRIMALVHQAFTEGTAPLGAPFLPASVLSQLPPEATWKWKTRGGARMATLLGADDGGPRLSLLVAPHGFRTPSHVHFGSEQMLVLEGLMEDGEAAYPTGCWTHFGEGSTHAPLVLNEECWCLIREQGPIRYTGPLGWLRNFLAA